MPAAFRVVPAEDADFPILFALLSESFAHNHQFIESFYPHHETPAGRAAGASRLLSFAKGDPTTHFMKCIDESMQWLQNRAIYANSPDNAILGFTKWNVWIDVPPTFQDKQLPWAPGVWDSKPWEGLDGDMSELARWTLQHYVDLRLGAREHSKGRLVSLDLMCVSPKHQRRGVGQLLMKWGCEQADRYHVEAVVEASDEGFGLYKRFGFQPLRHVELREPSGKWDGREKQQFWWMVRPANGKGNVSPELTKAATETRDGTIADTGKTS